MLDQLSEGRFEFGFGKGVSPPEHTLWGLDPAEAVPAMDEAIDIILRAFETDGRFSYEGRYHQFEDVPIEVRPYQQPYMPLWRPGTLETAARMGVRTMTGGPLEAVAAACSRYREHLDPTGIGRHHEPMIGGVRKVIVAPTDAEADDLGRRAWPAFTEHLGRLWRRYNIPIVNDPTIGGDFDRAKAVQAVIVGSPQTVREHCEQFEAEAGTDYFVGQFAWGDLSIEEVTRSFDLFAEHVAQPLQAS
jgi:alkanesulfonate monooxygenase SsuD/methylene tetrahydromethanopterin reductase-like flavin-dependent oxidoreductase (luciferase family)